jgi:hypothetical protein
MKKLYALFLVMLAISTPAIAQLVVPNSGTTGTTLYSLATINGSGDAVIASTTSTGVPSYIVSAGAGTSGNATLMLFGQIPCTMDSTVSISSPSWYYVVASTTVAGDCHAQSNAPSAGVWLVGYLTSGSTISGELGSVYTGAGASAGSFYGGSESGRT